MPGTYSPTSEHINSIEIVSEPRPSILKNRSSVTTTLNSNPRDNRLSRKRWDNSLKIPFNSSDQEIATAGLAVNTEEAKKFANQTDLRGVPSIMNSYSLTTLGLSDNSLLIDSNNGNKWYEDKNALTESDLDSIGYANNATTDTIIKHSENNDPHGKRPYTFSDFVFVKYWNKIPNNRLITLRRFGLPVNDSITFQGEEENYTEYVPIAQALTYIGEEPENTIANLLGFKSGVPWKDIKAEVMIVGQDKAAIGDTGSGIGAKLGRTMSMLTGAANKEDIINDGVLPPDPYTDGPYNNVIQGPVNRIDKTKGREAGIIFEQPITLNFHYVARPIGGINSKAVMLDILANLLILTGAEAAFWGGMHRFRIAKPKYPFAGGLAGKEGQRKLMNGDASGFFDSMLDGLGNAFDGMIDAFTQLLSGGNIGDMLKKGAGLAVARKMAGKKPYLTGFNALLTGNPVGEWHLTVGNPLNPMIEMGNMICTGMDIKFSEEMGPDDFPLELKATITLDHGMPRDIAAIQSMFNKGHGKIYTLPEDIQWMGSQNSKQPPVDAVTKKLAEQQSDPNKQSTINTKTTSKMGQNASSKVKIEIAHAAKIAMGYATDSIKKVN